MGVVDAFPRPLPDPAAHALVQVAAEKVDALTTAREVDGSRLLRMQLGARGQGQHRADPVMGPPRPPPSCHTSPRNRRRSGPACPGGPTDPPRSGQGRAGRCLRGDGEMTPPCGVPATVRVHSPSSITPAASHCRNSFIHPPIRDPPRHQLQQVVVGDAAKVVADVCVQHVVSAACPVHVKRLQRLGGTALRPKPIRGGAGSRPQRWAPARSWSPSARPDPVSSGCRAAADGHRPSECIGAGPAAADTCLRVMRRGARRACAPRQTARRPRASRDRRPPRRDSPSPAATPPTGRHACRSDRAGHGSGAPGIAWLRPRGGVAIGALCQCSRDAHPVIGPLRSCPRAVRARPPGPPQGPFAPSALFVADLAATTIPLGRPPRTTRFHHRLIRAARP